jgi:hypothetical protein
MLIGCLGVNIASIGQSSNTRHNYENLNNFSKCLVVQALVVVGIKNALLWFPQLVIFVPFHGCGHMCIHISLQYNEPLQV